MKIVRNILPGLLILCPYVIYYLLDKELMDFFGPMILIIILLAILNIISALSWKGFGAEKSLALWGMIMKIALVPAYLFIFAMGIAFFIGGIFFIPVIFGAAMMIILLVIFDVMLLVSTSSYSVKAAYLLSKRGTLSKGAAVVLSILSFFFVIDVIVSVVIFVYSRKKVVYYY